MIDDDHVLQPGQVVARLQQPLEVLALDHGDAGGGVGDDVLDLVGGVGLVDREGRRAERDRGEVDDVELGTVGEHDRERLPARAAPAGAAPRRGRARAGATAPR